MEQDFEKILDVVTQSTNDKNRFSKRINALKARDDDFYVRNIEEVVSESMENIHHNCNSFVIYGEPQSGKTEMMIALTARLLDENFRIIVVLVNDNLQLLSQNLDRFTRAGIDPAPKGIHEIKDPGVNLDKGEWVIFCTKNARNLEKLLAKVSKYKNKIIIDDEADYATPNSKINKNLESTINKLITKLVDLQNNDTSGIYIGVTATPARLNLNNTLRNNSEKWIYFHPHPEYTGQDIFFPLNPATGKELSYKLELLKSEGNEKDSLRKAIFRFLIRVSFLNSNLNYGKENNFCMLIHTSGKKEDQHKDYKEVENIFSVLKSKDKSDKKFLKYFKELVDLSKNMFPKHSNFLLEYIFDNVNMNAVVEMNSDVEDISIYGRATNPSAQFTFAIGGNIVSRGVTFNNLLTMYFTRDAKKIQQDTYIQRARMFGARKKYLNFFELCIPGELYKDWHKCFVFHRLSLNSIKTTDESPVWIEGGRITAASMASKDKTTVSMASGVMSFKDFTHNEDVEKIIEESKTSNLGKLRKLKNIFSNDVLPEYLIRFIDDSTQGDDKLIAIHKSTDISSYKEISEKDIKRVGGGMMSTGDLEKNKYPSAIHHIKIYFIKDRAKIYYKHDGVNLKFIFNKLK